MTFAVLLKCPACGEEFDVDSEDLDDMQEDGDKPCCPNCDADLVLP